MQNRITLDEMQAAARLLGKHDHGRSALRLLAEGLQRDQLDLDLLDQRAFLALLGGAWHGNRDQVARILGDVLANGSAEEERRSA